MLIRILVLPYRTLRVCLIFGVIFIVSPVSSGLCLYLFASSVFGIIEAKVNRHRLKPLQEKADALKAKEVELKAKEKEKA